MESLLAMIALWLSFNFTLPAIPEPPKIEVVPKQEILFRRYNAFTPQARSDVLKATEGNPAIGNRREPVALYDDTSGTIYLPAGWTGTSAADVSVLVHEMVHHIQRRAGLRYECPAQRETLAYQAQDRWLRMFGYNLQDEFSLDEFTLKVSTSCGF
jgi:hypothetical protein